MKKILLFLVMIAMSCSAALAEVYYKCAQNGRLTITQYPCPSGATSTVVTPAPGSEGNAASGSPAEELERMKQRLEVMQRERHQREAAEELARKADEEKLEEQERGGGGGNSDTRLPADERERKTDKEKREARKTDEEKLAARKTDEEKKRSHSERENSRTSTTSASSSKTTITSQNPSTTSSDTKTTATTKTTSKSDSSATSGSAGSTVTLPTKSTTVAPPVAVPTKPSHSTSGTRRRKH